MNDNLTSVKSANGLDDDNLADDEHCRVVGAVVCSLALPGRIYRASTFDLCLLLRLCCCAGILYSTVLVTKCWY